MIEMTVRELAAALAALPEELQDLKVFSTADWSTVGSCALMTDYTIDGMPVVEIASC